MHARVDPELLAGLGLEVADDLPDGGLGGMRLLLIASDGDEVRFLRVCEKRGRG